MSVSCAGHEAILVGMMKNERHYLLEWVAHYKLIGFERILVVTNDNTDGTNAVAHALANAGLIECIVHCVPAGSAPRACASKLVVEKLRAEQYEGYVAHFDADEFLVLDGVPSVGALLDRFEHGSSIAVNWKIFGSNGHEGRPEGLVLENYRRCAEDDFEGHYDYKTISWFAKDLLAFDGHNAIRDGSCARPHFFADGTTFTVEKPSARYSRATKVVHAPAVLNHYIVKSADEYAAKTKRGRIVGDGPRLKPRYTKSFFPKFDRNDKPGNVDDDHIERVRRTMERLYEEAGLSREFDRVQLGLPASGERESGSEAAHDALSPPRPRIASRA